MTLHYRQNIDNIFGKTIKNRDIHSEFSEIKKNAKEIFHNILTIDQLPLFSLPYRNDDLQIISYIADQIKNDFSRVFVLGTGGSSLNGQAISAIVGEDILEKKLIFVDNIDPNTIENIINCDNLWSHTAILVISKSGTTLETIVQFSIFLDKLKQVIRKENLGKHVFVISDPENSPIRAMSNEIAATFLPHNTKIGGRFAGISNVGLLPAAIAGLDIYKIREGAKNVIENYQYAIEGAALHYLLISNNYHCNVIMPYIDKLSKFANWYLQIWAETTGKKEKSSIAVKSMGTIDQHSQLQLYLDGPKNKFFTIITLTTKNTGLVIPYSKILKDFSVEIADKKLGDILEIEQQSTITALINRHCPVRHIEVDTIDEFVIGNLMMHFIIETILVAKLLDIDPFTQPAVEEAKKIANNMLVNYQKIET